MSHPNSEVPSPSPHPLGASTRRLLVLVTAVGAVLSTSGCGLLDSDGDDPLAGADTLSVAVDTTVGATPATAAVSDTLPIGPPTVTALPAQSEQATPPAGPGGPGTEAGASQEVGLDALTARVDRVLAGQEALARRLDSIAASSGGAGPAGGAGGDQAAGEVLGEAGRQVQGFGVGVAWSLVVLIVFNLAIRGMVWLLDTLAERNAARRLFFKRLVPVIRIVLWVFAAYLIVRVIFGVDAQGIVAAAAAVGVAIGFAAQDLLKNLFGGLILVFDQPFQVGDKVSVGGTYGEVVSIGLRSTRIVTPDDNLVSVPNAQVVDQQVANANAGELNCQVVTDLFLPGWADEVKAKKIAFEAAASSKYVFLNKPIVVLVADVFKETFLTRVRVKAYVLDPRLEFLFQSDVTERAREGFRAAGLIRPENLRTELVQRTAVGWDTPSSGPDRAATGAGPRTPEAADPPATEYERD